MSLIYKITVEGSPKIYIGNCKNRYLSQRLAEHRYGHKNGRKCESKEIFELPGRKRIDMLELVNCDPEDTFAVRCREQYWIAQEGENCVNKNRAIPKKFPITQKISKRDPINFIRFLFVSN
jgi:hypothetical protein